METILPNPALDSFVECYWSWKVDSARGELDPILPDTAPELIFHLESPPSVLQKSGRWEQQSNAFFICASQRAVRLSIQAPMDVFAIRFRPWGASRFTSRSMTELVDREIEPSRVFSSFGEKLVTSIRSARDNAERIAVAESTLQNALAEQSNRDELIRRVHNVAGGGYSKGREIAESLGVSDRTFRRLWRDIVGIEHRKFVSLMRVHRALAMIDAGKKLSAIAAECGYADQPHLAREVKKLCGLPASLLRKRLGADVYQDLYMNRPSAPWTRS